MEAVHVPEHGSPAVLEVVDVPVPTPDEGELRIDVRAAGINFADIEKRRGHYPDGPEPPYCPGLEVAGIVEETSPGVDFVVGDRVAALTSSGGYAERAVASADTAITLPDQFSFVEGATLPVQWLTAHNALFEWGGLESNERVLVTAAAGGVGTAAVQLAAAAGGTVVGAASTDGKRDLVREIGASQAIDYEAIEDLAVDLALDGVGGRIFTDAVEALAPGGRVVTYGMASGQVPTVATPRLFFQNRSVLGYHLEEALDRVPVQVLSAIPDLVEQVAEGAPKIIIDDTLPLMAADKAHRRLQEGKTQGKLVLIP